MPVCCAATGTWANKHRHVMIHEQKPSLTAVNFCYLRKLPSSCSDVIDFIPASSGSSSLIAKHPFRCFQPQHTGLIEGLAFGNVQHA
ncbi:hypothetical protein DUNSADRAFT_11385 [Dunaliella salina]|uniref:Encoded protein n=1 Tax=Dunaliella salina TaxID=3046 RepID=A0ABQ7GDI2_DUNSA|nr:hypothetical protein DUNSADRAFT_11385 [Dunaliella salina]|eukprot:KAF5832677.1 hypothetical protein DUNSADRAFT_11385 [Dunaliella salina]